MDFHIFSSLLLLAETRFCQLSSSSRSTHFYCYLLYDLATASPFPFRFCRWWQHVPQNHWCACTAEETTWETQDGDTKMNLREIGFGTMDWIQLAWGNVHLHLLWTWP